MDEVLKILPKYFESDEIHVAGIVVASYAGEQYSHHLADTSLGQWLKEQGVPAMYGVDTRALTKIIREEGSMLGRMLQTADKSTSSNGTASTSLTNGVHHGGPRHWKDDVEEVEWHNQNERNLVQEGKEAVFAAIC